jgi:hypothetical protein
MLKIDPNEKCDERPVLLECKQFDGTWKQMGGKFKCSHTAAEAVLRAIATANAMALYGVMEEKDIPKLSDFRFAFVDAIGVEPEVDDTSLAKHILNEIGSRK